MKKKGQWAAGAAIILTGTILFLLIGPLDAFTHGFYCDMTAHEEAGELQWYTELSDEPFIQVFSPKQRHFRGFEIVLINLPKENDGYLLFSVSDETGKEISETKVNVTEISPSTPYQVYVNGSLKAGEQYTLKIREQDCETVPYLLVADPVYLTEENIEGDLFIGYAYGESDFSLAEKALLSAGLLLLCAAALCAAFHPQAHRQGKALTLCGMGLVLTWNFMFNSFGRADVNTSPSRVYRERTAFAHFEEGSETYVTGVILAEQNHVTLPAYGLGRYIDVSGEIKENIWIENPDINCRNDDGYQNGYSLTGAAIAVEDNIYTQKVCMKGGRVKFVNGESFSITGVEQDGNWLILQLSSDEILSGARCGSLSQARFVGKNGILFQPGYVEAYRSQYGLQGIVFRKLARFLIYEEAVEGLQLLCSVLAAAVFMAIVLLISRMYGFLLAGCFYGTFLLSPWIVNFARNLYWVEFLWFLPMLAGLLGLYFPDRRKGGIISCAAAFLMILAKSLCGYEYLSTIMVGMVLFPCAELISAFVQKNHAQSRRLFSLVLLLGVGAMAGFAAAISIHAILRGEGDLAAGFSSIWSEDVLHRTMGGRLSEFGPEEWESLQASVWQVFCTYFHFDTQILTGVDGYLFPVLAFLPGVLLLRRSKRVKEEGVSDPELVREWALYGLSFAASVSWFILAKSHSQMHTHMNYVLWYFGFVQICFYLMLRELAPAIRQRQEKRKNEV